MQSCAVVALEWDFPKGVVSPIPWSLLEQAYVWVQSDWTLHLSSSLISLVHLYLNIPTQPCGPKEPLSSHNASDPCPHSKLPSPWTLSRGWILASSPGLRQRSCDSSQLWNSLLPLQVHVRLRSCSVLVFQISGFFWSKFWPLYKVSITCNNFLFISFM